MTPTIAGVCRTRHTQWKLARSPSICPAKTHIEMDDRPTEKLDGDRALVRLRGADVLATTFSARAADLSVPNLDNKSLAINPDDVRQSDPIAAAQTRDDDTFRINDVEFDTGRS